MRKSTIHSLKKFFGKGLISAFYRSLWFLTDEQYVKLIYRLRLGRRLDLENPMTFTEKLQWLKLNDRNPAYTGMADKIGMRSFVSQRLGEGHTVPLIGEWDSFDDIDFNLLPDMFVMKTTHDSGSYVICRGKASFDRGRAKRILCRSMRRNYYRTTRELQYRDIPHRIIAEKLLGDGKNLYDYKFFCFNGIPRFLYVEQESLKDATQAILDMDFKPMPFCMEDEKADVLPSRPECFGQMKTFAEKLSAGIPFLRVDMYCADGVVYIGELTFFHYGGYIPFSPVEWDRKIGDMLDLGVLRGNR